MESNAIKFLDCATHLGTFKCSVLACRQSTRTIQPVRIEVLQLPTLALGNVARICPHDNYQTSSTFLNVYKLLRFFSQMGELYGLIPTEGTCISAKL